MFQSVKALLNVFAAPIWICLFVLTDFVIPLCAPLFKWLWSAIKAFSAQEQARESDWGTFKSLKKQGFLKKGGIPIAAIKHWWRWHKIYVHRESSVLFIAPKGQGESQSFVAIIRDVCERKVKPVQVIFDPTGDIYRNTNQKLTESGYVTGVIDLLQPSRGTTYDPLSFPDAGDSIGFDRQVKLMCESIIASEMGNKQLHFIDFTRLLVREAVANAILTRKGDLGDCIFRIVNADERTKLINEIRSRGTAEDTLIIDTFAKMTSGKSGQEGVAMFSTVIRKLETFRLECVRQVSKADSSTAKRPRGWTWDDIFDHPQPSAIFVRTGLIPGSEEYVRLLLENAVNTVRRHWDANEKPLKHGLLLIGDEMQKLGFCQSILTANVELRKANAVNLLCYPSLSDVTRIYGEFADTLISGCELVAFGVAKESAYYRELSDLIGERTEFSHSESEGRVSRHERIAPLARPAWLRQLPYDELVGVVSNVNIHAHKLFEIKGEVLRYR